MSGPQTVVPTQGEKIRVLCVIMTKFFEGGGLTSVMLNYYRELWRHPEYERLFSIDFLSHGTITDELREEIEGHGCRFFSMPGRKTNPIGHYRALLKVLRQGNYDVMHHNCNSGLDAMELALAKKYVPNRICHVHNAKPGYPLLHSLFKGLLNRSYTYALAASEAAGKWLYGGTPFIVLNNAIDLRKFAFNQEVRERMRASLGIGEVEFVVGNVGRMNQSNPKNHGFLLRAFAMVYQKVKNIRLVIVGDGKLMSDWVVLAEELNVSDAVLFVGFKNNVSDYMQAFDMFCFPSQWEGLGMVAIEAQAAGLPCLISSNVPREVNLTDLVNVVDIGTGCEVLWADAILEQMNRASAIERRDKRIAEQIKAGGFDIAYEIGRLLKVYGASLPDGEGA